jgi:hypothetical protein
MMWIDIITQPESGMPLKVTFCRKIADGDLIGQTCSDLQMGTHSTQADEMNSTNQKTVQAIPMEFTIKKSNDCLPRLIHVAIAAMQNK